MKRTGKYQVSKGREGEGGRKIISRKTPLFFMHQKGGLWLIHLPEGPTAYFKLTNYKRGCELRGHGTPTSHYPEVILNRFSTRLGHTIGRMFASLFPQDPNFKGRRVVTFHNQRDFIFFRHHR